MQAMLSCDSSYFLQFSIKKIFCGESWQVCKVILISALNISFYGEKVWFTVMFLNFRTDKSEQTGYTLFAIPSASFYNTSLYGESILVKCKDNYSIFFRCPNI